jgi:hypothetical protein
MATYDSNKRYTWTPEDKFEFTGAEFGLILNAFRSILSTEEAGRIILANEANQVVERALAAAVEADVVKEAPEAPKQGSL